MKATLIIFITLLAVEGAAAWIAGGSAFLPAAASVCMLLYAAFVKASKPVSEGIRLLGAALLAVAGPMYYQQSLAGIVLCVLAMPTLLAATQALWELKWGAEGAAAESVKLRLMVFTVAVLSVLAASGWLGREGILPPGTGAVTATLLLLLALAGWEAARIVRLKRGTPRGGVSRSLARPVLAALGAAAVIAWLFNHPLAAAADLICRISPRAKPILDSPENAAPRPPPPPADDRRDNEVARTTGMGNSTVTGRHRMPQRSDLESTGKPELYVKVHDLPTAAAMAAQGPVYVRTQTFNRFRDNEWSNSVSGGEWIEDADDGIADSWTTLVPSLAAEKPVLHTVYLPAADGYAIPALQGVRRYRLGRVFAYPSEKCQANLQGDVSYEAESLPLIWDRLPNRALLKSAPGDADHLSGPGGELEKRLRGAQQTFLKDQTLLGARIEALREWYAANVRYSTRMDNPVGQPAVENFLFFEQKGYCDFYASSAVMILRAAGIPARLAHGWAAREIDPATGVISITDTNAHAWTEILVEDTGWVVCDFTPPQNVGELAPPPQPEPPAFNPSKFASQSEPPEEKPAPEPKIADAAPKSWWEDLKEKLASGDWRDQLMKWLPMAAGLIAALLLLKRLWNDPKARAAAAAQKARELRDRQPAWLMEFCELSEASGYPREEGMTVKEFFGRLRRVGFIRGEFDDAVSYHYSTRYEDEPGDEARERGFLERVRSFRGAGALGRGGA